MQCHNNMYILVICQVCAYLIKFVYNKLLTINNYELLPAVINFYGVFINNLGIYIPHEYTI